MADDVLVSIGRFARATGLTVKALRLYAEVGVLAPARVDELSGYRYYRTGQVATGQVVRLLRDVGVPVADLGAVLAAPADGADVRAVLAERLRADEDLLVHRRRLLDLLHLRLTGSDMTREITTRTWSADPALCIRGEVVQSELDDFLRAAYQALYAAAGRGPLTMTAPAYQRYHQRVDDVDTRVPIDACLPFAGDRAQPHDLPEEVDVLPALTMTFASTVLRGPEATYPAILDGSDAVADWTVRHGFDIAGPAYEIARHWMGEVGHPDNVFEVGFPISG